MLERTGFVLKLAERGKRESKTIRCQRFRNNRSTAASIPKARTSWQRGPPY